jgi:hypothetical protein
MAPDVSRIALHSLDGFDERFKRVAATSEEFLRLIALDERVRVERVAAGTNITRVHLATDDIPAVAKKLEASGMVIRQSEKGARALVLQFNESILQRPAAVWRRLPAGAGLGEDYADRRIKTSAVALLFHVFVRFAPFGSAWARRCNSASAFWRKFEQSTTQ